MSKIIRIGTRDSELALWQANVVSEQLQYHGQKTQIIPLKSTGDIVLDKPVYDIGISGVFTRTLDLALLNNEIDVAVHSFKDVPTTLPKGIIKSAVLKRGNPKDILVFKNNEEFLGQKDAIIATGSLRRKAQWLHRYPTHKVVGLRGNVNTRLEKLNEHDDWNAAIFAAAGLGRLGVRPRDSFNLDWMVPAPAQGAIMIACREQDIDLKEICALINNEETDICVGLEREFLKLLEGGCSAPIGALATIKDEELSFHGVLLSLDGKKKFEVKKTEKLGQHEYIPQFCADYIIDNGGKRIMSELRSANMEPKIFSTKALTEDQKRRFNIGIRAASSDFIKINFNRLPLHILKQEFQNVIFTSKNAVESVLASCPTEQLKFKNIYCVGRRTKKLIEKRIGKVAHSENSAKKLGDYLIDNIKGNQAIYFCSNIRLDTLPDILKANNIEITEIEAYQTVSDADTLGSSIEGVMFYSPSTVESFLIKNNANVTAFCIGETTAEVARKTFDTVYVSRIPTVEGVIDLVNEKYS